MSDIQILYRNMFCRDGIANGQDAFERLQSSKLDLLNLKQVILKIFNSDFNDAKYSLYAGYKKVGYLKQNPTSQTWSVFNDTNQEVAKIEGDFSVELFTKTQKIFVLKSLAGKKIGDLSVMLALYRNAKGEGQKPNLELTFNRCVK
jgi:hypothetical protein